MNMAQATSRLDISICVLLCLNPENFVGHIEQHSGMGKGSVQQSVPGFVPRAVLLCMSYLL